MNRVVMMGRLTGDAVIKYGENNSCVARYTLAVDRKRKIEGQPTADFINCISFSKTAEFLERFGRKGTKFVAEGRIQTGSYLKDDQKIYTTNVVVESIEFAESKRNGSSESNSQDSGFANIPDGIDEELPFV